MDFDQGTTIFGPLNPAAAPMHDILHDLVIHVEPSRVFRAFADPEGLDAWWTLGSSGRPAVDEEYRF